MHDLDVGVACRLVLFLHTFYYFAPEFSGAEGGKRTEYDGGGSSVWPRKSVVISGAEGNRLYVGALGDMLDGGKKGGGGVSGADGGG